MEILNIIDDHSRLLTASAARLTFKAADVVTVFRQAAAAHGLPATMLSGNGAVFTGTPRGHGKVALEIELAALHISFRHSRAYHPQTCGKIERYHQTLKKWLARQHPAATLAGLQAQLDRFTAYYNNQRPHRALGRRTPATAFAARPPAGPGGLTAAAHYRIRHDRVDDTGVITIATTAGSTTSAWAAPTPAATSWPSSPTWTSASSTATPASSSAHSP